MCRQRLCAHPVPGLEPTSAGWDVSPLSWGISVPEALLLCWNPLSASLCSGPPLFSHPVKVWGDWACKHVAAPLQQLSGSSAQ